MKTLRQGLGSHIIGYFFIGVLFAFVIAAGTGAAHADTGTSLGCAFANMIGQNGVPIPLDSIGCASASTSASVSATTTTPSTPDLNALVQQTVHDAVASSTSINIGNGSTTVTGSVDPFTGLNVQVNTPYGGISLFQPLCALIIKKIVVGGTALASDFSIHLTQSGADVAGSPQPGSSVGNAYSDLKPGAYVISESGGPAGYTASFSGDCDVNGTIVLQANGNETCTITNTFASSTATSTPGGGGGGSSGGGGCTENCGGGSSGGGTPGGGGGGSGGGTPSGGESGSGGGTPSSGGGNGPIVSGGGSTPVLGGGGFSPGEVLGASTQAPAAPGIPNTGVGDTAATWLILAACALIAILGAASLRKKAL